MPWRDKMYTTMSNRALVPPTNCEFDVRPGRRQPAGMLAGQNSALA